MSPIKRVIVTDLLPDPLGRPVDQVADGIVEIVMINEPREAVEVSDTLVIPGTDFAQPPRNRPAVVEEAGNPDY